MVATSQAMRYSFACPCGKWEHREVVALAAVGWIALERGCPKCRSRYLFVFQVTVGAEVRARFVQAIQFHGRDEGSLRQTLEAIPGITPDDVDFLLSVARLLSLPPERVS